MVVLLQLLLLITAAECLRLHCAFWTGEIGFLGRLYRCNVKNPSSEPFSEVIGNIDGTHEADKVNADVKSIWFSNFPNLEYFPNGIDSFFGELKGLLILNCALKSITQEDLRPFHELESLHLNKNRLSVLESGLFRFNVKLKAVYFSENQLKYIAADIFEPLKDLRKAYFVNNVCIDTWGLNQDQLDGVERVIAMKCQKMQSVYERTRDLHCATANSYVGFVIRGNHVNRGEFPFLVALVNVPDFKFFCGGSLITSKHVLTAAHCVHQKGEAQPTPAENIDVLLGRHNITLSSEVSSEAVRVETIFVHSEWHSELDKYDADLAILVMLRSVEFSKYVKPVCMIGKDLHIELSNVGTVVLNFVLNITAIKSNSAGRLGKIRGF